MIITQNEILITMIALIFTILVIVLPFIYTSPTYPPRTKGLKTANRETTPTELFTLIPLIKATVDFDSNFSVSVPLSCFLNNCFPSTKITEITTSLRWYQEAFQKGEYSIELQQITNSSTYMLVVGDIKKGPKSWNCYDELVLDEAILPFLASKKDTLEKLEIILSDYIVNYPDLCCNGALIKKIATILNTLNKEYNEFKFGKIEPQIREAMLILEKD